MGFWNKLKQGLTQLTGGGGNMQLVVQNPRVKRGETLNVQITLNATANMSGKTVNLEVAAVETIKYKVPVPAATSASAGAQGTSISNETRDETATNQMYHNAIIVDNGPVNMQQGETKQYNASIVIPENVQPSYVGYNASNAWRVRAFLDVPMGADIDEDVEITVL